MNTISLLRYGLVCSCLFFFSISSFAQTDCEPPTGIVAEFLYPFGDQLRVYWDYVPENYYRLTYGEPGFDPLLNEGDDIIETYSFVVFGPVLPADTHFDVYVQSICSEGDTSSWAGPYDLYRDLPPDSCGYDIEHACELGIEPEAGTYFVIPEIYHDHFPLDQEIGCHDYIQAAWYTFIAPENGEVVLNAGISSNYLTVFDEELNEEFCRFNLDTCGVFEEPVDSLRMDSVALLLIPGMQYYVATASIIFCDSNVGPFYWDTGLQLTSNSPEVLCDEPTDFEVNFQYPFGELGFGNWQSSSSNNEIYFGSPGFDPNELEGDSLFAVGSLGWLINDFPIDVHYDGYVRAVCDSLTSDWVGPVDIYRPLTPDSCGWDMEHACEIYPTEECTEYFIIPEEYQDYSGLSAACYGFERAGWYTFTVPETGEIVMDFVNGSQYYVLYNSMGEEIECFNDSCIQGLGPETLNEPVALSLNPGEQYYVATAVNFFWIDPCIPFWGSSGLCVSTDEPQLYAWLPSDTAHYYCNDTIEFYPPIIQSDCGEVSWTAQSEFLFEDFCETYSMVIYTVTDTCGNEVVLTQISVSYYMLGLQNEGQRLSIDCGTPDSLFAEYPNGLVEMPNLMELASVFDICSDVTLTQDFAVGSFIVLGSYFVTVTATDECGNLASCGYLIEVFPEPLLITHSMDSLYECDEEIPSFELEITGGCPPYNVVGEEESFAINECETITESYFTVQDECGQEVYVEHEYLVTDTTPPVVICPETDTIWTSGGFNAQPYSLDDAVISDNCNEINDFLVDPAYGEILPAGDYTLFIGAIDACGNEGSCSTPLIFANPVGLEESLFNLVNIYQQESSLWIDYPERLRGNQCQLYDLSGKKLREITLSNEPTSIDLSGLSTGTYLLTFSDGEQVLHSRRVGLE